MLLTACAATEFVKVRPDDPRLVTKLRLSQAEWQEIQAEIRKAQDIVDADKQVWVWGRDLQTGFIELWCGNPKTDVSGPVYFFRRDDGHWRLLREMSFWDKK